MTRTIFDKEHDGAIDWHARWVETDRDRAAMHRALVDAATERDALRAEVTRLAALLRDRDAPYDH